MVEAKNTLTSCCMLTSLVCFETRKYQKKSNGFSLSLENTVLEKLQGRGGGQVFLNTMLLLLLLYMVSEINNSYFS